MTKARLYYEAHVTIEPVEDPARKVLAAELAQAQKFRLATLLKQNQELSRLDTFMTGHGMELEDLTLRLQKLVRALMFHGFDVWRYKIEDTIMDSRSYDELELGVRK